MTKIKNDLGFAFNEHLDQLVHMPSLIGVFCECLMGSQRPNLSSCGQ